MAVEVIAVGETILPGNHFVAVGKALHAVVGIALELLQLRLIGFEEVAVVDDGLQLLLMRLIEIGEDILAKRLDGADDIPVLVVGHALLHKLHDPGQQRVIVFLYLFDNIIDGLPLHLFVVEHHQQVGGEIEFAGEVTEDALEEAVDGLYAEIAVVVHHLRQGFSGEQTNFGFG